MNTVLFVYAAIGFSENLFLVHKIVKKLFLLVGSFTTHSCYMEEFKNCKLWESWIKYVMYRTF